ncbi:MAG: hypothetical protein LBV22_03125 [Mycoplasmataceae bacterium]|nr:hypothetical protein [Mycoplasmataceae bacterium]
MNSNSETYLGVDDDDTKYMTNVISWGVIFITTFITFVLTYYKTNKEQVYVTHTELDIQTKVHNMSLLISQQVLSLTAIIVLSILVTVNWIIIVVFSICLISGVILILVDRGKISVGDKTYYWFEYCYICLCFLSLAVLIWQTINDITARWGEATTYADSEKLTISIIISGLFVIIDITILIYIMIRLKPKESRGFILDPSQTSEESS